MLPAGYLLKRVPPPPEWLADAPINQVCSVASCVNDDVVAVQDEWLHNGFGVANAPDVLTSALAGRDIPPDAILFYYEAYEIRAGVRRLDF